MKPLKCPKCKLLNPPGATRCDCGYEFPVGKLSDQPVTTPITKRSYNLRSAALVTQQVLIFASAFAGAAVAKVGFESSAKVHGLAQILPLLMGVTGIAVAMPCAYAFWRIRRKRQRLRNDFDQQHRITEDSAFILYLRSFQDDETKEPVHVEDALPGHQTREQSLIEDLMKRYFGCGRFRVLAIGNPDEELPPLGCTRYRISDDEWRDKVEDLMRRSWAVLLRPGITPAVLWETEKLLFCLPPQRVYVLASALGNHGATVYKRWRAQTSNLFPRPLPEASEAPFLIGFDDGWEPTHRAVNEASRLQKLASRAVVPSIQWMLSRVTQLGKPPPPLPIALRESHDN